MRNLILTLIIILSFQGLSIGFGALLGSAKVKIPVNGNIDTFNLVRENFQKIAME